METVDDCLRGLKIQLGSDLSKKILIYLDLNYWIFLRKCMAKENIGNEYYKFYEQLHTLVKQGLALCPINHTVFTELLKQEDLDSRIMTAKVIDTFSDSITLVFPFEREELELQYYIRQHLLQESSLTPIKNYVWIKIPYIMGTLIPSLRDIDEITQNTIQVLFLKHSWNITLEEIICNYLRFPHKIFTNRSDTAEKLNKGKFKHQNEFTTFQKLFEMEIKGGLSIYIDLVSRYFQWLFQNRPNILTLLNYKHNINNPQELCRKIGNDILTNKLDNHLSDFYIHLCIHTLMRWDKTRNFKANDLYDFEHARAALPYYQYFFTDGPLKHMLEMKPFQLSTKYNCIVENDIKKINNLLLQINII